MDWKNLYYQTEAGGSQTCILVSPRLALQTHLASTWDVGMEEESEKAGLKVNIQKIKIMASGPITSQ